MTKQLGSDPNSFGMTKQLGSDPNSSMLVKRGQVRIRAPLEDPAAMLSAMDE
jgi:hypothetical protein